MAVLALFVPSAGQCLSVAGPVVAFFGLVWLMRHGHEWVETLFPHWEWERKLGWLNFSAHRRADLVLRWIGHGVQAGLLVALTGIVWNAFILGSFNAWDDPSQVGSLLVHLVVLGICLALWILYLATVLAPRIRNEYEHAELDRFRRENPEPKEEQPQPRRDAITVWESPVGSSKRRD